MSQENVDLARQGYEALNQAFTAGDDLAALIRQIADPDIVFEMGVLEGTFRGREGVQRFLEGQLATVEGLRLEPEEFIAASQQVIVPFRMSGRIRSTGLPFEAHYVHLLAFLDGRVVQARLCGSLAKAFEAVGMGE